MEKKTDVDPSEDLRFYFYVGPRSYYPEAEKSRLEPYPTTRQSQLEYINKRFQRLRKNTRIYHYVLAAYIKSCMYEQGDFDNINRNLFDIHDGKVGPLLNHPLLKNDIIAIYELQQNHKWLNKVFFIWNQTTGKCSKWSKEASNNHLTVPIAIITDEPELRYIDKESPTRFNDQTEELLMQHPINIYFEKTKNIYFHLDENSYRVDGYLGISPLSNGNLKWKYALKDDCTWKPIPNGKQVITFGDILNYKKKEIQKLLTYAKFYAKKVLKYKLEQQPSDNTYGETPSTKIIDETIQNYEDE